jgi:S-adenosylmethionine synthetase
MNADAANTTVAEWVLPGHPDKLCDALADRIVGEVLRADPYGHCGIEAACAFDRVYVTGLIGCERDRLPDIGSRIDGWVRATYRSAGYAGRWQPAAQDLQIDLRALCIEQRGSDWQALRHLADDQCICIGYAQDSPRSGYLPGALWTARRIAQALHERQRQSPEGAIGPDGKVLVRGEDSADAGFIAHSVSMSLHHAANADWLDLRRHALGALRDALGDAPLPDLSLNPAGVHLCGGPAGDNGTTGKKLVMDAYGPGVPIGGGAWCGKDFHKPDRVGGLLARRLALLCVRAGVGRRVRVQLEYRPNSAQPESVAVWADDRPVRLPAAIRPASTRDGARALIEGLAAADFAPLLTGQLARWGHLGHGGSWWEPAGFGRQSSCDILHPARAATGPAPDNALRERRV